jgi:hypothetical protein
MAVIIVPADLVQRLSSIDDTGQTVLHPGHGILGRDGTLVTEIGGVALGFPNREDEVHATARCAFSANFSPEGQAAIKVAVPEAVIADQIPGDWRNPPI